MMQYQFCVSSTKITMIHDTWSLRRCHRGAPAVPNPDAPIPRTTPPTTPLGYLPDVLLLLTLFVSVGLAEPGVAPPPVAAPAPPAPAASAASPVRGAFFGATLVPAGLGALAWQDDDRLTGNLVGEFDGWIRPSLNAHGGWVSGKNAVSAGFGFLMLHDRTFADTSTVNAVGAFRPALDYRRYLRDRAPGAVNGYGTGGIYAVFPTVTDVSDSYTGEEQADAEEGADSLRAQIGGVGAELGIGAEYLFGDAAGRPAVALGVRYAGRVYRGQSLQEDNFRVSTVWLGEAALVIEFFL